MANRLCHVTIALSYTSLSMPAKTKGHNIAKKQILRMQVRNEVRGFGDEKCEDWQKGCTMELLQYPIAQRPQKQTSYCIQANIETASKG